MKPRTILIILGALSLAVSVLSCTINIGGPNYPTASIPISTEAVGDLQYSLETAVAAGVASGQITLTLTEPQLTSYLYYKLQAQSQPLITNPQVFLRDNQLQVYGTASRGDFEATVRITLNAGVDNQGKLLIGLTSANFGPLPVPKGLMEIITATIQEAYTSALGPIATGFRLLSVTISDGTMIIIGQTE